MRQNSVPTLALVALLLSTQALAQKQKSDAQVALEKKREQMTSEVRERQANKMPTTLHEKRIADFKNNSRK